MLQVLSQIEPFVYEWTSKNRGSISAEHGVGLMKAEKIFYSKSPGAVSFDQSVYYSFYQTFKFYLFHNSSIEKDGSSM